MASSSSTRSGLLAQWKYDVFLSFRGEDTRINFTGHLYEGLRNRGIVTFQDEKRLEHGDSIPDELVKAIKDSQVAVIIFSKNYASSRCCLNELVKIMECKDKNGQRVIPVFYGVDPAHVRYQSESFADVFAKHELRYKDDVEGMQKVKGWRAALREAANLSGCDTRNRIESECIRDVVNLISKLCKTSLSYLKDIVGINTHLEEVHSLLQMEINDVRIVGIWGMAGVGKTTIARAVFDTLSYQFEAACFLPQINKEECKHLQNILLSDLLREKAHYVDNKDDGKRLMARMFCSKKVLVVLDDIDHPDHLDYLAGDIGWFGKGSRIIATTRDKHLLGKHVYNVTKLANDDAIQLFSQHAFNKAVPDEPFVKLTSEVVSYADGLPLALKVFGSSLYKRDMTEWRNIVDRIRRNLSSGFLEELKTSYDCLERAEQEIFLDIACFLRGKEKDYVMQILKSCHFGADNGLRVLIDKSLVFISVKNTTKMHDVKYTIEMHESIQDMGKYVVNKQKDSGECSRLWLSEDFEDVMVSSKGTKAMEAIWVPYFNKPCFSKESMKIMQRLRMLCIHDSNCLAGSIEYLPNSLRCLVWNNYPCESLPESFEPKTLVHLDLSFSSLHHLWMGTKHLPFLRKLDLKDSRSLMQTPDFTWMPLLEYLDLSYCRNLAEVHHSLGYSRKLIELNLYNCGHLKSFPCVNMESLGYIDLEYCSSLERFPKIIGTKRPELQIKTSHSGIRELPSFITYPTHIAEDFEPELETSLQMRENNNEPRENCIGIKRSRYDNSEHHDEAGCSSSKKQRSHSNIRGRLASLFRNLQLFLSNPRI